MRQLRRLAPMLEQSPCQIVLMKFAHRLSLPHSVCRLVDYPPDWSVSGLILYSSRKETRAFLPVLPSGLHPNEGLAVGERDHVPTISLL